MRVGYINEITEDNLSASSEASGYPIENVLTSDMTTKYESSFSGDVNISLREDNTDKIVASDAGNDDRFGRAVSIDGDYIIVGANLDNGGSSDEGAAYIFHRTGTNTWDTGTKIVASDAANGDYFGYAVCISGDYAVVGANRDDGGSSDEGSAYIFHRVGTAWDTGTKIVASDAANGDTFGRAVSISGDYVVVGASGDDGGSTNEGSAYIFHRTGTNTWDTGTKIVASDAASGDQFGFSVSIDVNYVIVGAFGVDGAGTDRGAAYIFHRTGTTTWDTGTKVVASDAVDSDVFGSAVSIDGDYVIVGADGDDGGSSNEGSAYIFHRTGTTTWDTGTKIVASDAANGDQFGISVSIDGDYAIVGAYLDDGGSTGEGSAHTFYRTGTNTWDTGTKIVASDAANGDQFGQSVSIDGDYAIVGAHLDDGGSSNEGSAYIYTRNVFKGVTASMACINAHNMSTSDTATLKGYPSLTSSTPTVEYEFDMKEYGVATVFDEGTYFWEIDLLVSENVEIGGIFLGEHLITPAYEIGAKTEWITSDKYSISKSGQLYGDEGHYKRIADYLIPYMVVATEALDWLTFFKYVGTRKAFYLLQYPDSQDRQPLFYCHLRSNSFKQEEHEGNISVYKNVPFQIEEVF